MYTNTKQNFTTVGDFMLMKMVHWLDSFNLITLCKIEKERMT